MKRFETLRRRIDRLDERLAKLLAERAEVVEEIGRAKRTTGAGVFDPGRERAVRERLQKLDAGKFPASALEAIFREIVSASRALEEPTRVGFLGDEGSLAHWATMRRFGSSSDVSSYPDAEALLAALEAGTRRYAVVGLGEHELGPGGFDTLLSTRARIYGEFYQEPGAVLLGPRRGGSKRLFLTAASLAASRRWLAASRIPWDPRLVESSREAARQARAARAHCLGTPALAGPGLRILEEQVADEPRRRRRYWILSLNEPARSERDKTAFLAVLPQRPGALHAVLTPFARRGLNVVTLETRASHGRDWAHVFLFEIEGHASQKAVRDALAAARRRVDFYKGLGSFPADPA